MIADNLIKGRGLVLSTWTVGEEGWQIKNSPATMWAPGFPLCVAAVHKTTGLSARDSSILLEMIFITFMILGTYKIIIFLKIRLFSCFIFAFLLLPNNPIFEYTQTTSICSLGALVFALYLSLRIIKEKNFTFSYILAIAFFASLSCFFRYSYYFSIVLFPLYFAVLFLYTKNRRFLQYAFSLSALLLFYVGGTHIIQRALYGATSYLDYYEVGGNKAPFWGHLLYFDDFLSKGLLLRFNMLFSTFEHLPNAFTTVHLSYLIHSALLLLWVFISYVTLKSKKEIFELKKVAIFLFLLTALGNVSSLALLSLCMPALFANPNADIGWTFVVETRYYGPTMWVFFLTLGTWGEAASHRIARVCGVCLFSLAVAWNAVDWIHQHYRFDIDFYLPYYGATDFSMYEKVFSEVAAYAEAHDIEKVCAPDLRNGYYGIFGLELVDHYEILREGKWPKHQVGEDILVIAHHRNHELIRLLESKSGKVAVHSSYFGWYFFRVKF